MFPLIQKRWFQIFFLVVVVFSCYSFLLQGDFRTLDDQMSIVRNDAIKDFRNAGKILRASYFGTNDYYRPLVLLSYMAEYRFFGLYALYYYCDNVLLHAGIVLLVFVLFCRIFSSRNLAFAAALLYGLHPVHWEAVSNIPDRAILLCTLFSLLTFLCFLKRKESAGFYPFSLGFFALALLCKESAVVLPLVLLSYQYFVGRVREEKMRRWVFPVVPFCVAVIFYFWLRARLGITELFVPRDVDFILLSFLTFLRGLITYIRLFFLPVDLHFARAHRLLDGFWNFDIFVIVIFFVLLGFVLWKTRRELPPAGIFLISWFTLELLPVSQLGVAVFVQPGYISLAEHFLYTAAIGFCGALALGGQRLYEANARRRWISVPMFFVLTGAFYGFLVLTLVENGIYARNEKAMLERAVKFEPQNARDLLPLSNVYVRGQRFDEAERNYRKVLAQNPFNARARIGLGKALCDQGKYWEGLAEYESVLDPEEFKTLLENNKRLTLLILEKKYRALLAEGRDSAANHYSLGVVFFKQGRSDEAAAEFRKAVAQNPDYREAWFNLATVMALKKDYAGALIPYQKTLNLSSGDDILQYQSNIFLGRVYRALGRIQDAELCDKEAARIKTFLSVSPQEVKR